MTKRLQQRAAIWSGVSSRPQTERDSLEDQLRDGQALAEREGWQVVAELTVPGESRFYVDLPEAIAELDKELQPGEQNAYRQLLELIEGRKIDVLVVAGRDRLGRTDGLVSSIEDRLRRVGARVHSLRMPPTGSRTGDIYGSAVERANLREEIERLTDRQRRGMDARARRGMLVGSQVPFGYRAAFRQEGSRTVRYAVVEPGEADSFRWLVDVVMERTYTIAEARVRLLTLYPHRQWTPPMFSWMLRNPFYAGLIWRRRKRWPDETVLLRVLDPGQPSILNDPAWPEVEALLARRAERGQAKSVDKQTLQTKLHLVAPGEHEALVELGRWLDLQRIMEARTDGRRPWSRSSVWAGMLRCGICGAPLYYHGAGYYFCAQRKPSLGGSGCPLPYVRSSAVTSQVASFLRQALEQTVDNLEAKPNQTLDQTSGWKRQLAEIAGQRERTVELYELRRVSLEEFDRRAAKLEAKQAELRALLVEAQNRVGEAAARRERLALLSEILPDLERRIDDAADPVEVNRWLRRLFAEIAIADGKVTEIRFA